SHQGHGQGRDLIFKALTSNTSPKATPNKWIPVMVRPAHYQRSQQNAVRPRACRRALSALPSITRNTVLAATTDGGSWALIFLLQEYRRIRTIPESAPCMWRAEGLAGCARR